MICVMGVGKGIDGILRIVWKFDERCIWYWVGEEYVL